MNASRHVAAGGGGGGQELECCWCFLWQVVVPWCAIIARRGGAFKVFIDAGANVEKGRRVRARVCLEPKLLLVDMLVIINMPPSRL
jgi:hypothetical protein